MAKGALRVLAAGYKVINHPLSNQDMDELESGLIFVGMVGMIDPPRDEAKVAVQKCIEAGIKTVPTTENCGGHSVRGCVCSASTWHIGSRQ